MIRLFCIILTCSLALSAQQRTILATNAQVEGFKDIPKETIFVHYNSTLLFPGETLYYQIYCLDVDLLKQSNISKIAYLTLINQNEKYIFKHKIKLKNGIGYGDFFIPADLPSGNYKILAYTRWMLNENNFYQGDISILNPYQGRSMNSANNFPLLRDSLNFNDDSEKNITAISLLENKYYEKRDKVILNFDELTKKNKSGNYSLSIVKKYPFDQSVFPHLLNFISKVKIQSSPNRNNLVAALNKKIFLPEMRGELISGIVSHKERESIHKEKIKLGISLPANSNQTTVIETDVKGNFIFDLSGRNRNGDELYIQVLKDSSKNYNIILDSFPQPIISNLKFFDFKIKPQMKDHILQRSIYNQIENNYYQIKPDSIITQDKELPFYGKDGIYKYNLDDFTRFKTVKETLIEIVEGVWSTKDEAGKDYFAIRGLYLDQEEMGYKPLLLIDGIIEQDHNKIINSNADDIESISYIRDIYYLGVEIYGGVIIIKTKDNNYSELIDTEQVKRLKIGSIRNGLRKYFKYNYELDSYNTIPDYRHQLLWLPDLKINKKENKVILFTSDVEGEFLISLEGFTSDGQPVSILDSFWVK